MSAEEIKGLAEKTFAAATERVKSGFGPDGKKSMDCENKCGDKITITNMNVFMLPEEKKFEVLIVCLKCCRQLFTQYNYQNKN